MSQNIVAGSQARGDHNIPAIVLRNHEVGSPHVHARSSRRIDQSLVLDLEELQGRLVHVLTSTAARRQIRQHGADVARGPVGPADSNRVAGGHVDMCLGVLGI